MADDANVRSADRELYEMSRRGDVDSVTALLQGGAVADSYIDYAGKGACMMAAQRGHLPVVKLLVASLSPKAARTALTRDCEGGETCVALAAAGGHVETLKYLLSEAGDAVTQQFLAVPLSLAAYYGWLVCVQMLLQHGASVTQRDEDGVTPAEVAREYGRHPKQKRLPRHEATAAFLASEQRKCGAKL
eukprot:TRINITY_DN21929_c0_g1_i1.p1 TRINITY_DN21929_c0_g1~~TRINITY_DN21929_c0_g1_i1.p1  ORF type:complete len:189 (+),score=26.70 TRINITY_DN21929_c0_g1_i1:46-612(+)